MYHIIFIHSSLDGHLGCFHILAIVKNAVMNIGVYTSFQISVLVFFKNIPRGFPGGTVVKNLPANVGDMGSSPGPGRSHMPRSN